MIHSEYRDADTTLTPETATKGLRVRSVGSCVPGILYGTVVGPAPELQLGGPRVYVRSVSGWVSSTPVKMLTSDAPHTDHCPTHGYDHKRMVEYHITKTRTMPPSWTWGRPYKESAKDRNARKARMEAWYAEQMTA